MALRRRFLTAALALGLAALAPVQTGLAQSETEIEALKREIETLKQGQVAIRQVLNAILRELQSARRSTSPAPFTSAVLSVVGAAAKGNAGAKVTLIEFSDYQCPFCRRFALQTLPRLTKDYIATGKVRYVFRDFPIERIHPAAFEAAAAARCAGEQDKYWKMHDRFFAKPRSLAAKAWTANAKAIGLDLKAFKACMTSGRFDQAIRKDQAEGAKAGTRGTPSFFLGLTRPGGSTFKATRIIRGAQPYGAFKQAIDTLLKGKKG